MANKKLVVDGTSLTLDKIENFILQNLQVEISSKAKSKIKKSRALIEKWVKNEEVIYGVTTGFGEFSNVNISKKDIQHLQENLILSHSVGCGENLPPMIVKIMMLLRLNALAKGYSGIKLETLELLVSYDEQ